MIMVSVRKTAANIPKTMAKRNRTTASTQKTSNGLLLNAVIPSVANRSILDRLYFDFPATLSCTSKCT